MTIPSQHTSCCPILHTLHYTTRSTNLFISYFFSILVTPSRPLRLSIYIVLTPVLSFALDTQAHIRVAHTGVPGNTPSCIAVAHVTLKFLIFTSSLTVPISIFYFSTLLFTSVISNSLTFKTPTKYLIFLSCSR